MERIVNGCLLLAVFLLTQCNSAEGVVTPMAAVETLPPPQVIETTIEFATLLPLSVDSATSIEETTSASSRGQAANPPSAILQLPTATVAPSPTPMMYQIQAGDTLLGIAIQQNSTVAELEALNPTINPDLLSIGQLIQLPQPTRLPTALIAHPLEGVGAVSGQLSIHQLVIYQTPVGSLWILGELLNAGEDAVESVQVAIDLLDDQLGQLERVMVWTAVSTIQPGDKAPFGVLIAEPPEAFAQPAATIISGNGLVDVGGRYFEIDLLQTTVEQQDEPFQMTGQLENVGDQTASEIRLVATFYNDEQIITGFQQQVLDEVLGVGETAVFSFIAAPPGAETSSAAVIIEAVTLADE